MRVLITGGTGLLGKALIETSKISHDVMATFFGNYSVNDTQSVKYVHLDIRSIREYAPVFKSFRPEVVIHTAGIADVDLCQRNPKLCFESNVLGTSNIIDLCIKSKSKLVYISTNAVFDGRNPPYNEESIANPLNEYGKLKMECEKLVMILMEEYIIARPIIMYGWNFLHERKNIMPVLIEKLSNHQIVNIVNDVYENPLSAHQCATALWGLIEHRKHGVYHIAGNDVLSRYEFALQIADVFNLDENLICSVGSDFFSDLALRPKNTAFSTNKIQKELGFVPMGIREGLNDMKGKRPVL